MSMEHKAFVFDYACFETELKPLLEQALFTHEHHQLIRFIDENFASVTDPYEGNPLPSGWERWVSPKDAHQYGDYALTKFYDPRRDIGLGSQWNEIYDALKKDAAEFASVILGHPCGPASNPFDPGKMGSYFQTPDDVKRHLKYIDGWQHTNQAFKQQGETIKIMLNTAISHEQGLYITF